MTNMQNMLKIMHKYAQQKYAQYVEICKNMHIKYANICKNMDFICKICYKNMQKYAVKYAAVHISYNLHIYTLPTLLMPTGTVRNLIARSHEPLAVSVAVTVPISPAGRHDSPPAPGPAGGAGVAAAASVRLTRSIT